MRLLCVLALTAGLLCGGADALTFKQIGDASLDSNFTARVKARLCQAAPAIVNENPATANHAARMLLAARILQNPDEWAVRFAPVVAGQPTPAGQATLAAVTDAQITTAVDSLLDSFALTL